MAHSHTALCFLLVQVFDAEFRAPFSHVNRWFVMCVNQPQFKAVLGTIELCTKMAQFDGEERGVGTIRMIVHFMPPLKCNRKCLLMLCIQKQIIID